MLLNLNEFYEGPKHILVCINVGELHGPKTRKREFWFSSLKNFIVNFFRVSKFTIQKKSRFKVHNIKLIFSYYRIYLKL
jgi:hypothetical protein